MIIALVLDHASSELGTKRVEFDREMGEFVQEIKNGSVVKNSGGRLNANQVIEWWEEDND